MSPHGGIRRVGSLLWSRLRGSLWPLPVLAILAALGLGIGLPGVDRWLQAIEGERVLSFVFGGGPSAARDLLAAIAGSLISVTGLTFSFTVVALQLSSSQHSPRLLQTFVTDRVVQATLAQLVGTFVYALVVLREVRTEDAGETGTAFVPRLSVTVGFALTVISVVALVLFLGHLARSLRVETMLRDVHDEASTTYNRVLPPGEDPGGRRFDLPGGPPEYVLAGSSGFLTAVDTTRLVRAAAEAGATVLLTRRLGDSVITGTPLALVWPAEAGTRVDPPAIEESLRRAVDLAFERTPDRDIAYSLRKVVDITVRALSPGTNDPTTAVHGLGHVSAMLGDLVGRPLGPVPFRDDDGVLRLVLPQWDAGALLQLGLEEPLMLAEGQPAVLRRIAAVLRELAWRAPPGTLDEALRTHLGRVTRLAEESTSIEEGETTRWRRQVEDALLRRWQPEASLAGSTTTGTVP